MSALEDYRSKKIWVLRNGDSFTPARKIAVSSKIFKNFEQFLLTLSGTVKLLGGAVRHLYTLQGIPIPNIDSLQDNQFYVAAGNELFKRVNYKTQLNTEQTAGASERRRTQLRSRLVAKAAKTDSSDESQIFRPTTKGYKVILFVNGDANTVGKQCILNYRNAKTFEKVLQAVSESVHIPSGPVAKLYDVETGVRLTKLPHLRDGQRIALASFGQIFQKLNYQDPGKASNASSANSSYAKLHSNSSSTTTSQSNSIKRTSVLDQPPKVIRIFPNGDSYHYGYVFPVHLTRTLNLNQFIAQINKEHVASNLGQIKRLYTIDGDLVVHIDQLEHAHNYVMVPGSDAFLHVSYNLNAYQTKTTSATGGYGLQGWTTPGNRSRSSSIKSTTGNYDPADVESSPTASKKKSFAAAEDPKDSLNKIRLSRELHERLLDLESEDELRAQAPTTTFRVGPQKQLVANEEAAPRKYLSKQHEEIGNTADIVAAAHAAIQNGNVDFVINALSKVESVSKNQLKPKSVDSLRHSEGASQSSTSSHSRQSSIKEQSKESNSVSRSSTPAKLSRNSVSHQEHEDNDINSQASSIADLTKSEPISSKKSSRLSLNSSRHSSLNQLNESRKASQQNLVQSKKPSQDQFSESRQSSENKLNESANSSRHSLIESRKSSQKNLTESRKSSQNNLTESRKSSRNNLTESRKSSRNNLNESGQNSVNESRKSSKNNLNESAKSSKHSLVESTYSSSHQLAESRKESQTQISKSRQSSQNKLNESAKSSRHSLNESRKSSQNNLNESRKESQTQISKSRQSSMNKLDESLNSSRHSLVKSAKSRKQNLVESRNSSHDQLVKSSQSSQNNLNESRNSSSHSLVESTRSSNHDLLATRKSSQQNLEKSAASSQKNLSKSLESFNQQNNGSQTELAQLSESRRSSQNVLNKFNHSSENKLAKSEQSSQNDLAKAKQPSDNNLIESEPSTQQKLEESARSSQNSLANSQRSSHQSLVQTQLSSHQDLGESKQSIHKELSNSSARSLSLRSQSHIASKVEPDENNSLDEAKTSSYELATSRNQSRSIQKLKSNDSIRNSSEANNEIGLDESSNNNDQASSDKISLQGSAVSLNT